MDVNLQWIKQIANPFSSGFTNYDMGPRPVTDSSGNVYITYFSNGTLSGGTNKGSNDVFVVKLNSSGNIVWIRQQLAMNTTVDDIFPTIAIDPSNNIYVTYYSNGTTSGGTNIGGYDIVVFKMDSNGNLIWIKETPVMSTTANEYNPCIGTDSSGNVYVTYQTEGTISGGVMRGVSDIVVFKMDTNGNVIWIKEPIQANTTTWDFDSGIIVSSTGDVYVSYTTQGTISGGTFLGSSDIAVMKLDTNGNVVWTRELAAMNSTGSENKARSMALDSTGNLYLTYYTSGTISGGVNTGSNDIVVVKMSSSGGIIWTRQQGSFNTSGADKNSSIAIGSDGYLYCTYETTGTVSGGIAKGSSDIAVFKMDTNGNTVWVKQQLAMNTTGNDIWANITVDSSNNVYVSYITSGTVSGGVSSGSVGDLVVMKFAPPYTNPNPPPIDIRPYVESQKITYYWGFNDPSTISSVSLSCIGPGGGVAILTSNSRFYTFSNLTDGSNYAGAIVGFSQYGLQSISTLYRIVQPGSLSSPCLNVVFTKIGDSVQVTWDPPSVSGSEIKWYFLNSTDNSYSFGIEPFRREFKSTSIAAGTYTWVLRAVNDSGYGTAVYSSPFTFP